VVDLKISAPVIVTTVGEKLPVYDVPVRKGQLCKRVVCPSCGSEETGYYRVTINRMAGMFDGDGQLFGEAYDSVVDDEDIVGDTENNVLWDCNGCGHRFSLRPTDAALCYNGDYVI
jgi:hypothetical protein